MLGTAAPEGDSSSVVPLLIDISTVESTLPLDSVGASEEKERLEVIERTPEGVADGTGEAAIGRNRAVDDGFDLQRPAQTTRRCQNSREKSEYQTCDMKPCAGKMVKIPMYRKLVCEQRFK